MRARQELIPVGSKVSCVTHKGTLVSYFTAVVESSDLDPWAIEPTTQLFGVIDLGANHYYSEDGQCHIKYLVVHVDNLDLDPEKVVGEEELCMSRGPRIGAEGMPYCKLPKGHKTPVHRPAPSDGWELGMSWQDFWTTQH